jgi:site-specific recombinase XerD
MKNLREKMVQVMQQRNFSERTIKTYLSCISQMSKHYKKSPDLLTVKQVNDYLLYLIKDMKRSKSLVNQVIGAYKLLTVYVLKRKWKEFDIPRPKRERRLPTVLSKEEVSRIIKVTTNLKHKTLIMLTYSAGLRVGEVLNLKLTDINSNRMQIMIRQAKGHKDRNVMLSELILKQLRIYWKEYRPAVYLFEGYKSHQPYSTRSSQELFKKSVRIAGIRRHVTMHTLRHSFATHMVEKGVDIHVVQRLLGHSYISTTSGYLHLQNNDINGTSSPIDDLAL